ncbi:MAG: methylated-DNA--[protein]-cysteine S-methyltransferase [Candidatus Thalassarchaeaceae archaeon]
MTGTSFQNRVWDEIKNIPAGQTRTYKEIAVSIGSPGSSRAVAKCLRSQPKSNHCTMS